MRLGAIRARSELPLSARSDDMIEKLLRREFNVEEEDRMRIALPDLMVRAKEIRKQGYVLLPEHTVTAGAGVIGMLLPVCRHGRILAIGVGGLVERLQQKKKRASFELRAGIARFLTDSGALAAPGNFHKCGNANPHMKMR